MKRKIQLIEEAELRQEAYDKLTDKQKLRKLNKAGHVAAKQRKHMGWPELPKT